jgi:hypothetical protein
LVLQKLKFQRFFITGGISPKKEKLKIRKRSDFEGFQLPEMRKTEKRGGRV